MIHVTQPFLPPREEFDKYIDGIWERNWLTNNGPLVVALEKQLSSYFNLSNVLYLNNGTIALQIAIKALQLKGEIITTPFSYVATTSSIAWEGCKPVFADIDANTLNIDPDKIEGAITDKTSAILATHVYGNPCDIAAIEKIALKHKLKVIYDGAHCFGTTYKGKSVFAFGDVCTVSFHATKLFHTIEGGAVFTTDAELSKRMAFMRNFGHDGYTEYAEVGINGKSSEFHAAMGLANFKYVPDILRSRKEQSLRYDNNLKTIAVSKILVDPVAEFNYAYYPLILKSEETCLRVIKELEANKIYPRRYFSPGLNSIGIYNGQPMPVSDSITNRVICLPLYYTLSNDYIDRISAIVLKACNA
jgi:dTDP-4-amino-4,6-dideoxygalactose transaminase